MAAEAAARHPRRRSSEGCGLTLAHQMPLPGLPYGLPYRDPFPLQSTWMLMAHPVQAAARLIHHRPPSTCI